MKPVRKYMVVIGIVLISGFGISNGQTGSPEDPRLTDLFKNANGSRRALVGEADMQHASRSLSSRVIVREVASPLVVGRARRVPSEYPTIQAAIDSASTNDTVLVADGVYYENIRFKGKRLIVASTLVTTGDTSHISKTIIDGSRTTIPDSGSVVYFIAGEDTNSVLCGFTIRGGTGTRKVYTSGWIDRDGGGILIVGSGAKLVDNNISENTVTHQFPVGGGVAVSGSPLLVMERNTIRSNRVYSPNGQAIAGGMDLEGTTMAVLRHNAFEQNVAWTDGPYNAVGGALYCMGAFDYLAGHYVMEHNSFEGNVAFAPKSTQFVTFGGGVVAAYVTLEFRNNRVVRNLVQGARSVRVMGGGVALETDGPQYTGDMQVTGNYIAYNQVLDGLDGSGGGGIGMYYEHPLIENNIIVHNSAPYGGGVEVFIPSGASSGVDAPVLVNNTITSNRATTNNGGAIASFGAWTPKVANTIAWGDTASTELYAAAGSSMTVLYSDIEGGNTGAGNIDGEPLFVAGDSLYNLTPASPCIGSGLDTIVVGERVFIAPPRDFDGDYRPRPGTPQNCDIGAQEEQITSVSYAHHVRLTQLSRDTLGIGAWVTHPLGHLVTVTAFLRNGATGNADSVDLADDGKHGDGLAGDGFRGAFLVPSTDGTLVASFRTTDVTAGTARTQPDAARIDFTRKPRITADTRFVELGRVPMTPALFDTSFFVYNTGWVMDSLTTSIDPRNVVPDSAVHIFPAAFTLAPGDSEKITLRIRTNIVAVGYYSTEAIVTSRTATGASVLRKTYSFEIVVTGITQQTEVPRAFGLEQNYPNPFNPNTEIRYQIPAPRQAAGPEFGMVRLAVYDLLGREVAVLVNETKGPGTYTVTWDASGMASGVYLCRMTAGTFAQTKRLVLLR